MKIEIEIGGAVRKVFNVISTVVYALLGIGLGDLGRGALSAGLKAHWLKPDFASWMQEMYRGGWFRNVWEYLKWDPCTYMLICSAILLPSSILMFYSAYKSLRQLRAKKLET